MSVPAGAPAPAPARLDRQFRHDVEGLRAVAIGLVAVYHVWAGGVSGGVDIFLLISGYFVAGGLVRRFVRGDLPALGPYLARLGRRLLPALIVVLATVALASVWLLPRTRWSDLAGQLLASLGYAQNWWLALSGSAYGGADVAASPLQHIWSLSVQGQLFVLLPVLLLLLAVPLRGAAAAVRERAAWLLVVGLAALSFGYAALTTGGADQAFAYYDTGTRAWEYLLGTIIAMLGTRLVLPRWLAVGLGWAGLAVVAVAGLVVDGASFFPGPAALVPLGGAAAVLLAGAPRSRFGVDRVLGRPAVASLGKYAYGFYLWHWPVLVFTVVLSGHTEVGALGVVVLLISAALAYLTHRFVEAPAREPSVRARPRPAPAVAVLLAFALVAASAGWLGHLELRRESAEETLVHDPEIYPGAWALLEPEAFGSPPVVEPVPGLLEADHDWPRTPDGCGSGATDPAVHPCSFGPADAHTRIALVGASHALNLLPALVATAERDSVQIDAYIKTGCLLQWPGEGADPSCRAWLEDVFDRLESGDYDAVMSTSTRPTGVEEGPRETVPEEYVNAWTRLDRAGVVMIGVRDVPWLPWSVPDCLAGADAPGECAVARSEVLDAVDPAGLFEDSITLFYELDLSDAYCDLEWCHPVVGNMITFLDSNHLTATFAQTMGDHLAGLVRGVLD